jgi:hypothetical protein
MSPEVVVVGEYQYEHEAEVARVALESEGIEVAVLADNAGGMLPALQLLFPLRLVVHRDDADRAREILSSVDDAGGQPGDN